MCVVVGRMELLPSFLRARLSAAANTDSQNSGPKMKSILTDEDDVP